MFQYMEHEARTAGCLLCQSMGDSSISYHVDIINSFLWHFSDVERALDYSCTKEGNACPS